jgi:hypothetical protein
MCRQLFFLLLSGFLFYSSHAQKGNNAFSLYAEAGIPLLRKDAGGGFFFQEAYGMGRAAQLTLSAGVSKFTAKNTAEGEKVTTRLVPFLLGYRQYIQHFFIEPKVGLGELGGKILVNGDYRRPSVAAFFGGADAGYKWKRLSAGINFRTVHGIEGADAGLWHDRNFQYAGVFVGYDLFAHK